MNNMSSAPEVAAALPRTIVAAMAFRLL